MKLEGKEKAIRLLTFLNSTRGRKAEPDQPLTRAPALELLKGG